MSNLSFSSLHVNNMTINNSYPLFKTSIEVSIPFKSYLGTIENAALNRFITDNENFGKQTNKNQKNDLTKEVNAFDKDRVSFWNEIYRIDKSYLKSADEIKNAAAQTVQSFIAPYKETDALPLNSKSGVFSEIIGKYKASPELMAAAKVIGVDTSFAALEEKNTACDTVYKKRNDEYAANEASGSSLKPAAVASYNMFCMAIEQAANLTPSPEIVSLFHKLDELRKKYHALGGNGNGNGKETPPADAPAK